MPNNKNNAPVKMSLGEFMGGEPTHEMSAFPTRPKERGYVIKARYNRNWSDDELLFDFYAKIEIVMFFLLSLSHA